MTYKDFFSFNRDQRIGLIALALIIIISQSLYFFIDFSSDEVLSIDDKKWLSMQSEIDSLKTISDIKANTMQPFNPNFISDYKGYKLGMKIEEIDRLLAFRKTNQYVNSAKEFQNVTKISDSLLTTISIYFKFPDWVNSKKQFKNEGNYQFKETKVEKIVVQDINTTSKEDLIKVYGIGDALSERILKQKELFGSFVSMEQLNDVWGLSPEVIEQLNKHYKISNTQNIKKIDINNLSTKELIKFPYFKYALAREIITYRSMNGGIKNIEDLIKIKGFPIDKIKIIALYLEF